MDQGASDLCVLESVVQALEDERAELEEKLETEFETSERQKIEERIGEIHADIEIQRVGILKSSSQNEQEVRRSEREKRPTEKMLELRKADIIKRERRFMFIYVNFKAEAQLIRTKLKQECSKVELSDMIVPIENYESRLKQEYERLRALTTPSQDIRRRMDSCTSATTELIALLKGRHAEVGTKEFDAEAAKAALFHLLQREDARSIYGSTVSRAGVSSQQGSQVSVKKAEAAARLASKRAEINREKEISAQRMEILAQQERLKRLEDQRDLEVMEAEYKVYAEEELRLNSDLGDTGIISTLPSKQPSTQHNSSPCSQDLQDISVPPCKEDKQEMGANDISMVQALKESLATSRLPNPEPFTFTGDPLKFIEWRTCFKALIETSCTNSAHRLFYLKKYISGEALRVLEGTFYRSDEEAYTQAWVSLNKRYGHPFIVQRAFRMKLSTWQRIGPRESVKLREFSDFLIACKNAMPHVQGLQVLDDCEENQKLLQKLPDWVTTRWNRFVTKVLDEGKPYPGFTEFSDFVAEEARIACNPISSLHALKGTDQKPAKEQKRFQSNTLMTALNKSQKAQPNPHNLNALGNSAQDNPSGIQNKGQIKCVCCQKNHFIYKCDKFATMPRDEKKRFVIDNKMCFACLRVGHVSKNCKKKATCNICRQCHPTPLHEERPQGRKPEASEQEQENSVALCNVKGDACDRTSMTVPVWISCVGKNCTETLVYALLDTQSSNTFIDQEVCHNIQADTEPIVLKLSTMTNRGSRVNCQRATGLRVRGYYSQEYIELPPAYTREYIPLEQNSIPTCETAKRWNHLLCISSEIPDLLNCPVGLLIGYDCSRALKPRQVISGEEFEPYAVKTDLGWSIVGSKTSHNSSRDVTGLCHRISVKELPSIAPTSIIKALEMDFLDTTSREKTVSQEDMQFLHLLSEKIQHNKEGHLEMPLPFRVRPQLPNNRQLAMVRLKHLKRKMMKSSKYKEDYLKFMNSMFHDGDAEEVGDAPEEAITWYIPHHGVYHPRKPEKIRVVFDCSAKFEGTSLNEHLLTGPDLNNALTGVLCRFREHQIAIVCDIEKMFHRFHVSPQDRDFLRFLWWENGNIEGELKEYRMRVHIFGAASSPGCANFAMKHLATKYEKEYPLAASFILQNFYVDDGLISIDTAEQAIQLVHDVQKVFVKGKLHLHKFVSNSREVLDSIPESERASIVRDVDLNYNELPMQSVLGVKWNVETDTFSFNVVLSGRSATRRGILSAVASIFDPLGFLSPFILTGKRILQEMCKRGVGWDEPLPPELKPKWENWLQDLENLQQIQIPRCVIPKNIGIIQKIELHHFSDASTEGYGQCSYIRIVTDEQVHCALIMGKARVVPSKVVSIPRLELTAATVSAAVSSILREELTLKIDQEFFWTDSKVVLGYIKNEAKRFHVFVANRVQRIRDSTDPGQWFYVDTSQNPADHASRGLTVAGLLNSIWLTGPTFLWERELAIREASPELLVGDPEVKVLKTDAFMKDSFFGRLSRISDWNTALNVIARIQRWPKKDRTGPITVEEREKAAHALIRATQRENFEEVFKLFSQRSANLPKTHKLYQLDPIIENGLLRVGGRLRKSSASFDSKHPIILPKEGFVTQLILDNCHKNTQHQGRGQTLNQLRACGYWTISASKVVAKHIKHCVTCRKARGQTEEQRMADLPVDRVEPSPPFTYTGMDCFGPFYTKQGRKEFKRYGLLFTCLSLRAIHLEMLEDLTTDAFLNALRCFIAIRGTVRQIRSDQGTNFVGAKNELERGLMELDKERISIYLARKQCDFLMNVPEASHTGGVWERQIRTVRSVMITVLAQAKGRLDDTSLRTFFYEAMAIVNSRPLTTNTLNDPRSMEPLTPNHLLTMKSSVPLPPPGTFVREDLYARKRWRRVQYLSEQFWSRWRKEYLANISLRQQWHVPRRNVQVGDVVIVKEDNIPRNEWKIARVVEASADDDGLVRKVKVQIGQSNLGKKGERLIQPSFLSRPVQKIVVLVENNS
ncbi:uncharacterized protein LOC125717469 [Brienomyrus brachyistius]|uniref:uncharacterized protein LOC125717469 n=1 Tax=Brienomyrus brachyistius TaxID=42636 RepID=UPI0020B40E04|nr:uncharacterized protein LOC125717469 [Brienomyrus brachyistius]XP_048846375.1 uncharacterized protein LOC125717469 [Brienomyrus brachyistius]XP_048846377.1 uncharacterized protein LOC125717469 [Brienomyrus brachyistius]